MKLAPEPAAVSRPSGLWQGSTALSRRRFECVALPPGAHSGQHSKPAGRVCSIWSTAFAACCKRGVPPSGGVGLVGCGWHGAVERSCRGDIDVVETKAQFCILAGLHIAGLHRARPLAQHGVRDSTHRRTCADQELDVSHVSGVQQARQDTDAGH